MCTSSTATRLQSSGYRLYDLARSDGFRAHELNDLREIIAAHGDALKEAWREHFDRSGQH
jgi:hypothetical protein